MAVSSTHSQDVRILDWIVGDLLDRHGFTAEELEVATGDYEGRVWCTTLEEARKLQPSTLGRIVFAFPRADLYGCHGGTWLCKYESGPYLFHQIVASVMICRMRERLGLHGASLDPHLTGPNWV